MHKTLHETLSTNQHSFKAYYRLAIPQGQPRTAMIYTYCYKQSNKPMPSLK